MKHTFSRVVAVLTLLLVFASMILTIAGAVVPGSTGKALLFTGIFGFVGFAIFGYILIAVYERVHMDEDVNEKLFDKSERNKKNK